MYTDEGIPIPEYTAIICNPYFYNFPWSTTY